MDDRQHPRGCWVGKRKGGTERGHSALVAHHDYRQGYWGAMGTSTRLRIGGGNEADGGRYDVCSEGGSGNIERIVDKLPTRM